VTSSAQLLDLDWRIRLAAFDRLRVLRTQGGGVVSHTQMNEGFEFEGERIAFRNPQKGIWRPRQMGPDGAALSIVTVAPKAGRPRPYDDQVASDADYFVYRYEGDDPEYWTNRALRRAMNLQRPLIYFYGLSPGIYDPIFPCYIESDHPAELAFHLRAGSDAIRAEALFPQQTVQVQREYATAAVKVRLHQRRFRELVINAYQEKCAVCRLRHRELLDAAHIIEDRDERGVAEIPNGLSLCGIHHDAYDAYILGISPDYRIEIRKDILEEFDGPMLKHGLQEMNGQLIHVPRADVLRPNRAYLEWRHTRFKAA
jgi:putative restriction endonuclease